MAEKRSGWFYVFVGCGGLLLVGIIVVGVGAFMTVRWAKEIKADLEDPERRTANATEVVQEAMGAETLPEGYEAQVALEAPFGMGKIVILTDGEFMEGEGNAPDFEHLLLYMEGPGWDSDWKKFARGGDPPFDNMDQLNINIRDSDVVGQGELTVGKMELAYLTHEGEFSAEGYTSEGVFSIILARCPDGDKRSRTLIWGGSEGPGEDGSLTGTCGDPSRIADLMDYFPLCGV